MDAVRQAEIEIMRYILANQDARDTARGIEKWWLPQTRPYSIADVEAALQELARRNLIRVWEPAAAEQVYGRSPEAPQSIEECLRLLE